MLRGDVAAAAAACLTAARDRGWRLATAESCTGGLIAAALTSIAGSSDIVEGGIVSYSNEAKALLLGVSPALIAQFGAVSGAVAEAMASGALARLPAASLAIAVTGIAGPGGGSPGKPVGLVCFGLSHRGGGTESWCEIFAGDRAAIRQATVMAALERLTAACRVSG